MMEGDRSPLGIIFIRGRDVTRGRNGQGARIPSRSRSHDPRS